MIRVLRGSAAPGFEFAALQFVNTGRTPCVLIGVPVVTLRLRGKTIGTASTPAGSATARYRLAPGAVAESALRDYSNCQAPLSDMIAVIAPGSMIRSARPGQLRACTLKTYPLTRPD